MQLLLQLLQPGIDWAATKAWFRPMLAVMTGVALAVQQYVHSPKAQQVAAAALLVLLPMAAASLGKSSSGIAPVPPPQLHLPPSSPSGPPEVKP